MAPLPTVVLLPGLDGTATLFEPLVGVLASTRCLPVAYPCDQLLGYDALEALVRARLPTGDPFLVVAESFSGPLGIRLAAAPPPGLAGVMLVATFATSPVRIPAWLVRALAPMLSSASPPRSLVTRRLLGPSPPPALADALMAAIHQVDPAVIAHRQVAVLEVDVRPHLANAAVPLAYLQATQDRVVQARCGRAIQAVHPGLELTRIPGPHLLLQSEPKACAAAIEGWWSSLYAPR